MNHTIHLHPFSTSAARWAGTALLILALVAATPAGAARSRQTSGTVTGPRGQTTNVQHRVDRTAGQRTSERTWQNSRGEGQSTRQSTWDRSAGTAQSHTETTLPDGRTRTADRSYQRTENGFTSTRTATNAQGQTATHAVTATREGDTSTRTVTHTNPQGATATRTTTRTRDPVTVPPAPTADGTAPAAE